MGPMVFTNLKYVADQNGNNCSILFNCNGQTEMSVGVNSVNNKHYDEIMRQVAAGTITIADAD
jgi:hypothetical protein